MEVAWHTLSTTKVLQDLDSNERGLSSAEAARRLEERGRNVLPEAHRDGWFIIFIRQFQSPLIYILLVAAAALFAMGEISDAGIIFAVLLFNAVIGTIQEGRAQNTLHALKRLVATSATVMRDGHEIVVPESSIVPGDVIILDEGSRVPADARVVHATGLKADESSLTGESIPVHKTTEPTHETASGAEHRNMVFMSTAIVAGLGIAVVVETGRRTKIGAIAEKISAIDTEVPLKANIRSLSHALIGIVALVAIFVFFLGLIEGDPPLLMFATVVSLAVSIIPEGLPVVLTLVLATGVARMSKRNVLVKKLNAVEALGEARVIAVDKTGTITRNELTVVTAWTLNGEYDVSGAGYEPNGMFSKDGSYVEPASHPELLGLGKIAALTAHARPLYAEESHAWKVSGDPTEAAMSVFAEKAGLHRDTLEAEELLVAELPFDYKLKYHAVLHNAGSAHQLYVAGAPEEILALSTHMTHDGRHATMSVLQRDEVERAFTRMSEKGLRVVACATRELPNETLEAIGVRALSFTGLLGMQDALRSEVHDATKRAEDAGIRVVMITGDHMLTARSIAKEAGIFHHDDQVLSGREMDVLPDEDLAARMHSISVFARVTPEHKLRIVTAYKKRGEIIAMTGDGVNDAPSLVAADLGVAMGVIGTEVAKEAADLILLDDNFGSIVSAVEEGRSIYRTIQKVILYLFSTSIGEVLALSGALALGFPLILMPVQIIWLNFVTDGFLDVALAMEPKDNGLLAGRFARPKRFLISPLMALRMALMAIPMGLVAIALYVGYNLGAPEKAGTVALTVLAVAQWLNAWNCRSETNSLFTSSPFTNLYLVAATATILILQLAAVYAPPLQALLHTVPLSMTDWGIIIAAALSVVVVEEGRKALRRIIRTA